MKKAISWILVIAIMLGFLGMIAFNVFAESYVEYTHIYTPEFKAGDPINTDFEIDVTEGVVAVENRGWLDENRQPATGAFVEDKIYYLVLVLQAPEGSVFKEDTTLIVNAYQEFEFDLEEDPARMVAYLTFDFGPQQIIRCFLEGMPEKLQPGPADVPEEMYISGPATIAAARWVDRNKQEVTVLEEGKNYLLEVTLTAETGNKFQNWFDAYGYSGAAYSTEIIDAKTAKAWFYYSLMPGVGDVVMTVSGLEVGKPVSGVQVAFPEDSKVQLQSITVWDDATNESVESGNFQKNKCYTVSYMLAAKEGYNAEDFGEITVAAEGISHVNYHYWNGLLQVNHEFITAEVVGQVQLELPMIQPGGSVAEAAASLQEGQCVIRSFSWWNETLGQTAQGQFQEGHSYRLDMELVPVEGYLFSEDTDVRFVEAVPYYAGHSIGKTAEMIDVSAQFELQAEALDWVELYGLPWGIEPGEAPALEVTSDGSVLVTGSRWVDENKNPVTAFEDGKRYYCEVDLQVANPGVEFQDTTIHCDGKDAYMLHLNGSKATAWFYYSLEPGVGNVEIIVEGLEIGKLAKELKVKLPEDAKVQLFQMEIYDDYEPLEESEEFQDNHRYEVYLYFEAKEGYNIEVFEGVTVAGIEEVQGYSYGGLLEVYFVYSNCDPLGKLGLSSSGLEVGKPVSDVQLKIITRDKAELVDIQVYDFFDGEPVIGNFQENQYYIVEYTLKLREGYSPWDGATIRLNRREPEWSTSGDTLHITEYFATCKQVESVQLVTPQIRDGMPIADAVITAETEGYRVECWWSDVTEGVEPDEETFRKGHVYELGVDLQVQEGYVFDRGAKILLDGKEMEDYGFGQGGNFGYGYGKISLKEKISKVELLGAPKSIAKGDKLPEISVPESAKYAMSYDWVYALSNEDSEHVDVVDKNGVYVLGGVLTAAEGCEFAEDVQLLIGGEVCGAAEVIDDMLLFYKPYALGTKTIDRLDLTVAEPRIDEKPEQPSLAPGTMCQFTMVDWMECSRDNWAYAGGFRKFASGNYYYLQLMLETQEGYAFGENLEIYLNGQKGNVVQVLSAGVVLQVTVSFGQLQEPPAGDLDGEGVVTEDDAVYLLQYVLMPDLFEVHEETDFDGSGAVDEDDAVYLLQHILMPDLFPL